MRFPLTIGKKKWEPHTRLPVCSLREALVYYLDIDVPPKQSFFKQVVDNGCVDDDGEDLDQLATLAEVSEVLVLHAISILFSWGLHMHFISFTLKLFRNNFLGIHSCHKYPVKSCYITVTLLLLTSPYITHSKYSQ